MSHAPVLAVLRARLIRHRGRLNDALLLICALLVAVLFAFGLDVFHTEAGQPVHRLEVELNELLALGCLTCLGLVCLAGRWMLEQRREIARRTAAEGAVRVLAFQDPLTGLANRRSFDEALARTMATPPGANAVHAVLLLDLNGFKRINDVFGHGAGDEVLSIVGRRLGTLVRAGDMVARLGGDEFAVLAHHLTGPEGALGLALRIVEALSSPVAAAGAEHAVGTGIGIALCPRDGVDAAEILRKADVALYRAKAEGHSSVSFFEERMDEQLRERDGIERELRAAIGAGTIQAFYQPLVDLKTGNISGFEALARWNHPTRGSIPPDRFIPIAEDCGLIRELTGALLRQACRAARAWPAAVTLAFNISPVELKDRTLGLRIMTILAETGLAPHRLEIEITESALVRDMATAQHVLGSLREAGVRIALDDFGTGYSSLYHLRNFKLDKIKIDRSFVDVMQTEPESAAIVSALLGLGRGLGLTVVAEGVESTGQASALLAQGCDQGQGYLYGRAVSAADTAELFAVEKAKRA
ncbi:MAG: hypothetical protein JWR84_1124 [Caulobacter sp.]|nr:hypothetical protein [Caulobacter sp.]